MASRILTLSSALILAGVSACQRTSDGRTSRSTRRADAPIEFRIERDVSYLGAGRAEKADLYIPSKVPSAQKPAAIVVIHGGAWSRGDKADRLTRSIAADLAHSGFVAMSINYMLSTPAQPGVWPRNLIDCKSAVRWLRRNADRLGIDADHIGAIGASAGGQLCAMLAVSGPEDSLDVPEAERDVSCRIQAAVDLYGPVEIGDFPMMGAKRADAPELFRQASPLSHLDKNDPPILIIHGSADETVPPDHSTIFAAALQKAGVKHELIIVDGARHGFDLQPPQKDLRAIVAEFFRRHLASTK